MIPTTGGPLLIEGIQVRTRLKSSYAVTKGDFRPLGFSPDYARFVSGPLAGHIEPGPYELSLSGPIDSGRSWELPVLLAHLLHAPARLSAASRLFTEAESVDKGAHVVWATGAVDTDLNPSPGSYEIARKLAASEELFDRARQQGLRILLLLPADISHADLDAARAAAVRYGASLHEVASLGQAMGPLGLPAAHATDDGAVEERPSLEGVAAPRPARRFPWLWAAGVTSVLMLLVAGYSGLSNLLSRSADKLPTSVLLELAYAEGEEACQDAILENKHFRLVAAGGRGASPSTGAGQSLCGLFVRNIGGDRILFRLDSRLRAYAIQGDNPLFAGIELASNQSLPVFFARRPPTDSYELTASISNTGNPIRMIVPLHHRGEK